MKKTKLKLDKQTIKQLTNVQLSHAAGGDDKTHGLCATIAITNCGMCVTHDTNCCTVSAQWTCATYGCGTTATVGC